jgi:hypothetical protein
MGLKPVQNQLQIDRKTDQRRRDNKDTVIPRPKPSKSNRKINWVYILIYTLITYPDY